MSGSGEQISKPSGSATTADELASKLAAIELNEKVEKGKDVVDAAADYCNKRAIELKKSRLEIFQPLCDFGYFSWKPQGEYMSLSRLQSTTAITRFIDNKGEPPKLISVGNIKTSFRSPPPNIFMSMFPFGDYDIASIHVAVQRGLKLEEVDFCFGGSTLHMLANTEADDPYIAQRIPGRKCIVVAKKKAYEKNLADIGFQFERLVTGGDMMDSSDCSTVEHIHTMKVGSKIVLFCAEVDAMNEKGLLVEIKANNPRYWGNKIMFQMISNGGSLLCHGVKSRGTILDYVTVRDFASVAREATSMSNVKKLEDNIIQGMKSIEEQLRDDLPHRIVFSGGKLILRLESNMSLFPPKRIVEQLITSSEKR